MYDQKYIDMYSEKRLEDILVGNVDYVFDVTNKNSLDEKVYYAFQHFLIKSYLNGQHMDRCKYYLKIMYNDFRRNPHLFCDSPLLANDNLDKIFGNLPIKDQIKNYRNNYYSRDKVANIYSERSKRELTEVEKNQYYSYLFHMLNSPNKGNKKILDEEAQRIMNSNPKDLTDMELKFYCQYVSNFALGLYGRNHKTNIVIGTDRPGLYGYETNDYIFINKDSINSMALLTETVCHETRHSVQEHDSKNKNTQAGIEMAQMALFTRYLSSSEYDYYHTNYRYSSIELDAEKMGHWSSAVLFTTFKRSDLAEEIRERRKQTTDEKHFYGVMFNDNKKVMPIDQFNVDYMDRIIKDNPEELENYPVLKNMYEKDGTKKSFSDLMTARAHENIDERGLYDNYINNGIFNGELSTININGQDNKKILSALGSIYRGYALELNDYYHDTSNRYGPNQVAYATDYKLNVSFKVLKYINANYEEFEKSLKGESFDHKNPLYDFIYDLRDFDINSIENQAIKNNPRLLEHVKKVKEMSDNISQKFNHSYVDSKLNSLPQEITTSVITVPGVGNVVFADYFRNVIVPKMNGHKEVEINGQKYYVGDLIIEYSKYTSELLKAQNIDIYESGKGR